MISMWDATLTLLSDLSVFFNTYPPGTHSWVIFYKGGSYSQKYQVIFPKVS